MLVTIVPCAKRYRLIIPCLCGSTLLALYYLLVQYSGILLEYIVPLYLLGLTHLTNWRRCRGHDVTNCFMPRSFLTGTPLPLDSEIEKTTRRIRRQAKLHKRQPVSGTSSPSTPPVINIWEDIPLSSVSASETESPSLSPQTTSPIKTTPPSSPTHNIPNSTPKKTSIPTHTMGVNHGENKGPPNPPRANPSPMGEAKGYKTTSLHHISDSHKS